MRKKEAEACDEKLQAEETGVDGEQVRDVEIAWEKMFGDKDLKRGCEKNEQKGAAYERGDLRGDDALTADWRCQKMAHGAACCVSGEESVCAQDAEDHRKNKQDEAIEIGDHETEKVGCAGGHADGAIISGMAST